MSRSPDIVAVFADLDRFTEPRRMGSLRRQAGRGGEVFSFEYDPDWLKTPDVFSFDPDIEVEDCVRTELYGLIVNVALTLAVEPFG